MSRHVTPGGRGTGWAPSPPDMRDYLFAPSSTTLRSVPDAVDLRASGFLPAIMDQGQLGSCTAHGGAAVFLFALNKQGMSSRMKMPSRLGLYYDEREILGTTDYDSGAAVRNIFQVLKNKGVAHSKLWPYDISRFRERPPDEAYADALNFQAIEYARVTQSLTQFQATLAEGYPIVFGCTLYESFESDKTISTGMVRMPRSTEQIIGGHCMTIVGYVLINASLYFVVQNSWGVDVGDEGFFYMPPAYLLDPRITQDIWVLHTLEPKPQS